MNTTETQKLTYEKVTLEKTFTTFPKKPKTTINICRKGSIVKERCKQLMEVVENLFPDRVLSDDDLSCLIQDYIGADKETVRSYKGYSGHIRAGRCGDNKIVGCSRKGYLEVFGYLRKVPGRRWMIVQSVLPSLGNEESCVVNGVSSSVASNQKISISASPSVCVVSGSSSGSNDVCSNELEEEEGIEKERNFSPMISPMIRDISEKDIFEPSLSGLEAAILTAKPVEKETDKARVDWGACQE